MKTLPTLRIPFLLLSIAAAGGCGSGGGPGGTDPGDAVLVENTTEFAVSSSGGGFVYPPPQGAACDPGPWSYTVRIATSELAWDRCDVAGGELSNPAAYSPSSGTRILSVSELDAALSAARMVHVSKNANSCGADKPSYHMSVTSPAGSTVYGDDFYACLKLEDRYVVSGELDALAAHLRALVP